jgi:hypothetical protein
VHYGDVGSWSSKGGKPQPEEQRCY